jgi:hypothetical protein
VASPELRTRPLIRSTATEEGLEVPGLTPLEVQDFRDVEKDYWLAERRSRARDSAGITIILKGGISLSKVFGLIQPFSEDVDVLVVFTLENSIHRCNADVY